MEMRRRSFLFGMGAVLAAPLVVKAEILMPVKKVILPPSIDFDWQTPKFYSGEMPPPAPNPGDVWWKVGDENLYMFANRENRWVKFNDNGNESSRLS